MHTPEDALDENRRLRRTMQDLVALSNLPSVWEGQDETGICRSLAEILLSTLALELAYVRLGASGAAGFIEAVHGRHGPASDDQAEVARSGLEPLLGADSDPATTVPDPFGGEPLRVAVTRFRIVGDHGVLVAGSRDPDFPGERDLLLLGVAASQAAAVIQRQRTAAALRESELRYHASEEGLRALVTATSDVVYRMSPDWTEMRELDGRELLADTREPSQTWLASYIPADEKPRVLAAIRAAIRDKTTFELEHRVIRVDGSIGWTFSRAIPILGPNGDIVEWFGAARDVTRRKEAEEDLARVTAESERRRRLYETILGSTPDLVYVFGLDHRFTYANDVLLRMWGKTWEEAIGKNCLELGYEPWHAAMHDREIEQVVATKQPIRGEVPFSGTFGRRIYDYIFVPVLGPGGDVVAVAGTTRDVTERKEMEETLRAQAEQLREADRRKDEFLGILAHELRNPLAPFANGLQVMRLAKGNSEAAEKARSMMERQLGQMVRLIDDLLDVSRITQGKIVLKRERTELAVVVQQAVETSRPLIEQVGHELTIHLPPQPIFVDADVTRLAQVFSNLLNNAAKFTDRGGHVWLTVVRQGGEAVVSVRDTGVGIPAPMLPKVFDLFTQVDRSLEKSQGGLGIGLSLVKGLVEMHGGSVEARSEGQGKGSEIVLRLPVVPSPSEEEPGEGAGEGAIQTTRRRILVVDDNRDAAESLAMMLGLLGNEVRTAHDGLEALDVAAGYRPDLILLDIGMPKMNGYDACRGIRQQPWGRNVVLVALTGWGQEEDRRRSQAAGFDYHFVKPVDSRALMRLLAG